MTYCPECGGEVLPESAVYCYRCGVQLRDIDPDDIEDDSLFTVMMEALLDAEISHVTSDFSADLPEAEPNVAAPSPAIQNVVRQLTTHTIGYGKGLSKMVMLDMESTNDDVEYGNEDYAAAYKWVQQTVESREEYIEDVLHPEGDDE